MGSDDTMRPRPDPLIMQDALAVPSARAQHRAGPLMAQLLRQQKSAATRTSQQDTAVHSFEELLDRYQIPLQRRYPQAETFLAALGVGAPDEMPNASSDVAKAHQSAPFLVRPGQVRPGVRRPTRAERVPQDLLEKMVSALQVQSLGEAGHRFHLDFDVDGLGPVGCDLEMSASGIVAHFVAEDGHTRRLLDAESNRLRAQLEATGLKAYQIIISGPAADEV